MFVAIYFSLCTIHHIMYNMRLSTQCAFSMALWKQQMQGINAWQYCSKHTCTSDVPMDPPLIRVSLVCFANFYESRSCTSTVARKEEKSGAWFKESRHSF